MTLVYQNAFDDFMLSLDDPLPSIPNEYHDSITTPVLVSGLNDRRESSNLNDKIQQHNLTVNVFEIRLMPNDKSLLTSTPIPESKSVQPSVPVSKFNLQLKIETGDQKAKTGRKSIKLLSTEQTVIFNETFTFNYNTILSQFLDHTVEFRLLQSGRTIKGTKTLGKVDLDLVSLYNEPGMAIKDHSLALFSEQSSELVGYLKCDLIIDLPNVEKKETLLPIIRPVTPLSRHTPIESHARSMCIKVNVYSGDMPLVKTRTKDKLVSRIRSRKSSGLCVSLSLGDLEGSTSSIKHFTNPIWNETITFNTTLNVDKPPSLMVKVHDKSGSSSSFKPLTRSIDLSKICLDRNSGPIYGPSYLVVKETPKNPAFSDNCLTGKLLISIRATPIDENLKEGSTSDKLPSENQENLTDFNSSWSVHDVSCSPIESLSEINYPQEDEFTFLGLIYSSDMIPKKLETRKISYQVEISNNYGSERCDSPSMLDLTLGSIISTVSKASENSGQESSNGDLTIASSETNGKLSTDAAPTKSSVTIPLKPEASEGEGNENYLKLPYENRKPLLGLEQLMVDTRSRSFVYNMIRRIRDELEIGLTDVREMALVQHADTFRRFRGVLEDLMVHCNRFLALTVVPSKYPKNDLDILYIRYRQRELIKLLSDVKNTFFSSNETNLPEYLSTATSYLGRIEELMVDPQDDFPDIIIYLMADFKKIGFVRIPVADVIYSRYSNEKGSYCAKTSTYYIKSIKHPEIVLNRISLYTWFGLKRHKRHSTEGITPGYEESLQLVFFQSLDGTLPSHLIYPSP